MTYLYKIAPILSGFALAGLLACAINIRLAMTAGMGTACFVIAVLFFFSLSDLNSDRLWSEFFMKSGMPFITFLLVSFYYFCLIFIFDLLYVYLLRIQNKYIIIY